MLKYFSSIAENKSRIAAVAIVVVLVLLQGLYCYDSISASKSVLLLCGIAVILVIVIALLLFSKLCDTEKGINRVFLGALLLAGSFYLVIFPPNTVPDEVYHFQASYKYSNAVLGEGIGDSDISIRNEDRVLFEDDSIIVSSEHYRNILNNFELFASQSGATEQTLVASFGLDGNPPQTKIASVVGICLGKVLGLGAYPLYYLGRLFNLIVFALCAFFAIKLTPCGKNIFRAVALLPMTLHLAASYSYDVAIIGMSFLLTALCLKAIYESGPIGKATLIGIGILVFLIAPCKVIYSLIALLVLFIPKERFSSRRICYLVKGGILLVALVGALVFRASSLFGLAGLSDASGGSSNGVTQLDTRGAETGHFYSLSDVISDPIGTFLMYVSTFGYRGDWYVETTVGGSLGWFQVELIASDLIVYAFVAILLLSSFNSKDNNREISPLFRTALILIFIIVGVLAGVSMLLGHTFIGEKYIEGVQGRYLLPVLPLLLIALRNSKIFYKGNPVIPILIGGFALNLLYLNNIFAIALGI